MAKGIPALVRPNGKMYHPRKIQALTTGDEDEVTGIVVFGTHDVRFAENEAHAVAKEYQDEHGVKLVITGAGVRDWLGTQIAGSIDDRPLRIFVQNEETGRACVRFEAEEVFG